jgi:hypothetical protein
MHYDGYNDVFATGVSTSGGSLDPYTYAITIWVYWIVNGQLDDTDVLFNADLPWATDGNPNASDVETIALHEYGHVLGLDEEPDDPNAVMYPYGTEGQVIRNLTEDDKNGARELYPGGSFLPPSQPPPSPTLPPVKFVSLTDVTLSSDEARVGEMIKVTGTLANPLDEEATVNSVVMSPSVVVENQNIVLPPGGRTDFAFDALVVGDPGRYPATVRAVGSSSEDYFRSTDLYLDSDFTIRRHSLGYTMQDALSADLGPEGEDTIHMTLLKRSKVQVELNVPTLPSWKGERYVEVRAPDGKVLRSAQGPGTLTMKPFRVKQEGTHEVLVRNLGGTAGRYVLVTTGKPPKKRARSKVVVEPGQEQVELQLPPLPARSELTATIKVKRKRVSQPRIVGYRTPSGFLIELAEPRLGLDAFPLTESGAYRLLLEFPDGTATKRTKVRLKGTVAMTNGQAYKP